MTTSLYKFEGHIIAVGPLAVSRPGDNFASSRGSEKMGRLPRMGIKNDDAMIYFPATSLRRLLRESARNLVRKAIQRVQPGPPFSLETHMMLTSGIDISNRVLVDKSEGRIDAEAQLREENPLLSVFGRWKLAGHLHVGNAIPQSGDNCLYIEGSGARQNDFERDPAQAEFLSIADMDRLRRFIRQDSQAAKGIEQMKTTIKELKAQLKTADKEFGADLLARIKETEGDIKAVKVAKEGSAESIKRPLEGFEAIREGTVLNHCMRLDNSSDIELGFVLACLREACRHPLVGGHRSLGCGEIKGDYHVLTWPTSAERPSVAGAVQFGFDGFALEGGLLLQALKKWDDCAENIVEHFNFERFLVDEN